MADSTTRLNLPYPQGGDAPPDVAKALRELSEQLDEITMSRGQGLLIDRPAARTAGRMYWATDQAQMYFDDGTTWTALGPAVELPIGSVLDWPAATAPPGPATWLELNGDLITRGEYAELFAAWNLPGQSAYLPDRRGRSPMGAGKGQGLTARAVGTPVGEEEQRIAKEQLPDYQLPVTDNGHAHGVEPAYYADDSMGSLFRVLTAANTPPGTRGASVLNSHSVGRSGTGIVVRSGGGGLPLRLTHPSLVTRYFVRAR